MIREKYKWYISVISMSVAIILTTVGIVNSTKNNINSNSTLVASQNLSTVLDSKTVTDINIDISESDWEWLIENATNEEYKSCNITINGETYYNVGIRPKGNTSLTNVASDDTTDRYSFKIKFDEYVDGQTYNGMDSIVLNNMIQDNTYMKEYITYDLYSKLGVATPEMSYSDVKVNGKTWGLYLAIEVLDKRYLENNFGTDSGNLYKPETMSVGGDKGAGGNIPQMNGEKPMNFQNDKQNAQINYQNEATQSVEGQMTPPNGNAQMGVQNSEMQMMNPESTIQNNNPNKGMNGGGAGGGRPTEGADFIYIDDEVSSYSIVRDSAVFKSTTDEDFERVINMFKNLNDGTNLEDVLDVEEVLKYFAVNAYVINLDSYSGQMYHNYYLYENNGKCQILPWDLNLSFAGYGAQQGHGEDTDSSSVNTINFPIDNPVSGNLEDMPLIGKLLEVDEYKELYHSYLQQIADQYFNSGYYENLIAEVNSLINEYVKEDPTAFCTYDEYTIAVNEMINFGVDRTKSVLAQLSGDEPSTTYGNIESTVNISALGDMGGMMAKGNKGNMMMENNMQNPNGAEQANGEAMQKPEENQVNPNGAESNKSQSGAFGMDESPMNNANNENQQINPTQNTNEDMRNDKMNKNDMSEIMQNNISTNSTNNYLFIAGFFVLGILGVIFTTNFKRKRIR